jgi:hypothetical protein
MGGSAYSTIRFIQIGLGRLLLKTIEISLSNSRIYNRRLMRSNKVNSMRIPSLRWLYGRFFFTSLIAVFTSTALAQNERVFQELGQISSFKQVNLDKLLKGDILVEKIELKEFPRGIAAEACFLVKLPAEEVVSLFANWEASHSALHPPFHHKAFSQPPQAGDLEALDFKPQKGPVNWLIDKTRDLKPGDRTPLLLSPTEQAALEACAKSSNEALHLAQCWRQILLNRASRFHEKGVRALEPYENQGITSPAEELDHLLSQQPKISRNFSALLQAAFYQRPLQLSGGETEGTLYWELLKTNDHGVLSLGLFLRDQNGRSIESSYYASSETYFSVTFRQVWHLEVNGKPVSLVWRAECASSPHLENAKAVERIAARTIMTKNLKHEIEQFQKQNVK